MQYDFCIKQTEMLRTILHVERPRLWRGRGSFRSNRLIVNRGAWCYARPTNHKWPAGVISSDENTDFIWRGGESSQYSADFGRRDGDFQRVSIQFPTCSMARSVPCCS